MQFILKVFVFLILLSLAITIFEKVTGINITGDAEKEEEKEEEQKVFSPISPLEIELEKIKPGAYQRAKTIAEYIIQFYPEPYVEMGSGWSSVSIDTIVSKYIDNQFLFSEKYEDHVIDLIGNVETIGKDNEGVYISIGDGKSYHRSGMSGESVDQLIKCYIDDTDMVDEDYRKMVLNMRPGAEVMLVGVLGKGNRWGFELYGSTLIEVNGIVPDRVLRTAANSIREKYETESDPDSE